MWQALTKSLHSAQQSRSLLQLQHQRGFLVRTARALLYGTRCAFSRAHLDCYQADMFKNSPALPRCALQFEEQYLDSVIGILRARLTSTWNALRAIEGRANTSTSFLRRFLSCSRNFSCSSCFQSGSKGTGSEVCTVAHSHQHGMKLGVELIIGARCHLAPCGQKKTSACMTL
jgi:hypothetical protein